MSLCKRATGKRLTKEDLITWVYSVCSGRVEMERSYCGAKPSARLKLVGRWVSGCVIGENSFGMEIALYYMCNVLKR